MMFRRRKSKNFWCGTLLRVELDKAVGGWRDSVWEQREKTASTLELYEPGLTGVSVGGVEVVSGGVVFSFFEQSRYNNSGCYSLWR